MIEPDFKMNRVFRAFRRSGRFVALTRDEVIEATGCTDLHLKLLTKGGWLASQRHFRDTREETHTYHLKPTAILRMQQEQAVRRSA